MTAKQQPTPLEYIAKLKPGDKLRGNVLQCIKCGFVFWASRSDRKYCSGACRVRKYREKRAD